MSTFHGPISADVHRQRLAAWRDKHPGSPHAYFGLDELEALKAKNDGLAEKDRRERPAICESYPSFMTIGNTHKCNLTCQMCFKQLDDVKNMTLPDMGKGMFERIAHELFPHLRHVALSVSGEPLLSPTIFDEFELLATYGVRASITSNGMLLAKKEMIERMLPATGTLTISMDGASEPTFNAIRRLAKFDRVVANIQSFNDARNSLPADAHRPTLQFSHILQYRNVTELPKLIELAHELQVDQVHVDHIYIHKELNAGDSLQAHRHLANEMMERARCVADKLEVDLRLPDPYDVSDSEPDAPYQQLSAEALLEQARERLQTVPFDPKIHERWDLDPQFEVLDEIRKEGGSNQDYVDRLLDRRALLGHLKWGLPQIGESLIPAESKKVSACQYAWRESYIEYNGLVAPCCNASMGAGRVIGHIDDTPTFREIWNGDVYQRLRNSLSSGSCYEFCRTCYLYEPVDDAAWGMDETWFKVKPVLEGDRPVEAGQVPAGNRIVLTEVRSGDVPEASRLEILAGNEVIAKLQPSPTDTGWSFNQALEDVAIGEGTIVHLRCSGVENPGVELTGFLV